MFKRTIAVAAIVVLAGLLAAGCGSSGGGGDSSSTSSTGAASETAEQSGGQSTSGGEEGGNANGEAQAPPLSKAAFIKRADSICNAANLKIGSEANAVAEEKIKNNEFDRETVELEVIPTVLIPTLHSEVEGLRALGVPKGDAKQVEAIFDQFDKRIGEIESDPTVVTQGGLHPYAEVEKLAKAYGLSECPGT